MAPSTNNRQQIRATQVRAPDTLNDQIPESTIAATADTVQDAQAFLNLVISQIRIFAGSEKWFLPPLPGQGSMAYRPVFGEELTGDHNGQNLIFSTAFVFMPQSLALYYNGQRWAVGQDNDYIIAESGGDGTGFNQITLVDSRTAPLPSDSIKVDYVRA